MPLPPHHPLVATRPHNGRPNGTRGSRQPGLCPPRRGPLRPLRERLDAPLSRSDKAFPGAVPRSRWFIRRPLYPRRRVLLHCGRVAMKLDVPHDAASTTPPPPPPLPDACPEHWAWNEHDKSHEVRLSRFDRRTAHFHPNWSNGTAGVRATRALGGGVRYWQIDVSRRIFGTSMMFGVGTRRARLHADAFVNLLGEDDQSWGLSHKGLLWHDGSCRQYTKAFRENESTVIGMLYDSRNGTLVFYKDGTSLGVAFSGLHHVHDDLFPIICSTAAKTQMSLSLSLRSFDSLQDRCRAVIAERVRREAVHSLPIPTRIQHYIKQVGL